MEAEIAKLKQRIEELEGIVQRFSPAENKFERMKKDILYKANIKGYHPKPSTLTKYGITYNETTGKYN